MSWVWLNGSVRPAEEARVSALDEGILHARGLFETFRARKGRVYRLEEHFRRLGAGARYLNIPLNLSLSVLGNIVREITESCSLEDARVRLTLTSGPRAGTPNLLLHAAGVDYAASLYESGMTAILSSLRRNETSPLSRFKTLAYLDSLIAIEEAQREGADQAILLNTSGLLAEAATANIFIVADGDLLTPPLADGALPGVTRAAVLEMAGVDGIPGAETSVALDELRQADEAFLTNAVMGVMPLIELDGAAIGDGKPGELTLRLKAAYDSAAPAG